MAVGRLRMNSPDVFSAAGHEPKNLILREMGLPILFGAAVLLFSATMLLGVNIAAVRSNVAWIEHNQKILLRVSDAEAGVVGEQLTVRSYALTGDSRFLDYQTNERRNLANAMAAISLLAASDPADAARVGKLKEITDRHTALWESLRGIGPDRAGVLGRALVDKDLRRVMLGTRKELADYRADKLRSISERQSILTAQLSRAFLLAVGITIAAFLLCVAGVVIAQIRIPYRRAR